MNDFDLGQCEDLTDHKDLADVAEMRPIDPYADLALRDNYTRNMAGLDDWQADFPVADDDDQPSELTEWNDFDPDC